MPATRVLPALGVIAVASLGLAPVKVDGHAYMMQPISRNFWGTAQYQNWDSPFITYCPHCFQSRGPAAVRERAERETEPDELEKYGEGAWPHLFSYRRGEVLPNGNYLETDEIAKRHGICGDPGQTAAEGDNKFGQANVVYPVLGTYAAGDVLEVKIVFSTYHWGHLEFFLCDVNDLDDPDGRVTQSCFNKYPLDRADDDGGASPIDPNHKGRYYVDPVCMGNETDQTKIPGSTSGHVVTGRYKLPEGVTCSRCVVQMVYYTGNACKHPGYDEFNPPAWPGRCAATKDGWVKTSFGFCGESNYPEEFWNCADIEITGDARQTPAPVPAPTPKPVSAPTPEPVSAPTPETGPVEMCTDYIPGINANDVICCPNECGQCGGSGCASAGAAYGLGRESCCGSGVKSSGRYCDETYEAPCILGSPPEPTPAPTVAPTVALQICPGDIAGINANDVICCPIECGQCGGSGCASAGAAYGLGAESCCGSGVKSSGRYCAETDQAPCILGSPPEATPAPTQGQTCPGDIPGISAGDVVCCPVECGQCAGKGCSSSGAAYGLGHDECCGAGVKNSGKYCEVVGFAPCILGSPPENTPAPTPAQMCTEGIAGINAGDVICCPAECGQCAGSGCSASGAAYGLGPESCCGSGVKGSGRYCDVTGEAPCIIGSPPQEDGAAP